MRASRTTLQGESATRLEVRKGIEQGWKVSQIARMLGISTQAVYKHVRAIRDTDAEKAQTVAS